LLQNGELIIRVAAVDHEKILVATQSIEAKRWTLGTTNSCPFS